MKGTGIENILMCMYLTLQFTFITIRLFFIIKNIKQKLKIARNKIRVKQVNNIASH